MKIYILDWKWNMIRKRHSFILTKKNRLIGWKCFKIPITPIHVLGIYMNSRITYACPDIP